MYRRESIRPNLFGQHFDRLVYLSIYIGTFKSTSVSTSVDFDIASWNCRPGAAAATQRHRPKAAAVSETRAADMVTFLRFEWSRGGVHGRTWLSRLRSREMHDRWKGDALLVCGCCYCGNHAVTPRVCCSHPDSWINDLLLGAASSKINNEKSKMERHPIVKKETTENRLNFIIHSRGDRIILYYIIFFPFIILYPSYPRRDGRRTRAHTPVSRSVHGGRWQLTARARQESFMRVSFMRMWNYKQRVRDVCPGTNHSNNNNNYNYFYYYYYYVVTFSVARRKFRSIRKRVRIHCPTSGRLRRILMLYIIDIIYSARSAKLILVRISRRKIANTAGEGRKTVNSVTNATRVNFFSVRGLRLSMFLVT